jgi:hypothetical protein
VTEVYAVEHATAADDAEMDEEPSAVPVLDVDHVQKRIKLLV